MESWRKVWRLAAPMLPTDGLTALRDALTADDSRLIQGCTTSPPPLSVVQDWPVEAACLFGYCGWQDGTGRSTVADVEHWFAELCYRIDEAAKEPAACRWLLNWFDETPRDEMRRLLLEEVELTLAERAVPVA